jgi:hypothetical protein
MVLIIVLISCSWLFVAAFAVSVCRASARGDRGGARVRSVDARDQRTTRLADLESQRPTGSILSNLDATPFLRGRSVHDSAGALSPPSR